MLDRTTFQRILREGSAFTLSGPRFFVALSLLEAETLRGILHRTEVSLTSVPLAVSHSLEV